MKRIVCLSAESADILCRLGAGSRLVGVTAYASLPARWARVPRVSGYSSANLKRIIALRPDLVLGYSNVQAEIAQALIQAVIPVCITQQTSLAEIEQTIRLLGRLVDRVAAAERVIRVFRRAIRPRRRRRKTPPRVYFEEWPAPLVTGIGWVSELIERAGGRDIFADRRPCRHAAERQVTTDEILARDPEIIIASWCGRPVRLQEITRRPGWSATTAVRRGNVVALESSLILQPGPRLALGFRELSRILGGVPLR